MKVVVYINRNERVDAIEAYKAFLNEVQKIMLEDEERDYKLIIDFSEAYSVLTPL